MSEPLPAAAESIYAPLRRRMVQEQLRNRGIRDERVLAVMGQIPRERFVGTANLAAAYDDRALPIAEGQTISQPYMVAAMTAALQVAPTHRVLEIGTGSGYQTAILARLAREVYTIERIEGLAQEAARRLRELGFTNILYRVSDGTLGWPEAAPFDRILSTLTYGVAGIAAISLSVAGILVMNVMLVAVTQRTAEIGLMKALGAEGRMIRTAFLTEAALLSAAGAVAGAAAVSPGGGLRG